MAKSGFRGNSTGRKVLVHFHILSQIDKVCKYILTQEEHHKKFSFKEEYIGLLKKFGIEYDEKYLFEWYY